MHRLSKGLLLSKKLSLLIFFLLFQVKLNPSDFLPTKSTFYYKPFEKSLKNSFTLIWN